MFGVVPALQASRVDLNGSLRQGGRGGALAGGGSRLRSALVVAEVALAVALVVGASLLIRSFVALGHVSLGFSSDHLLVMETSVPTRIDLRNIAGAQRATAFYANALPRLAAVPGVTSVAGIRGLPEARSRFGHESNGGYWLEGGQNPETVGVRLPQAAFTVVTPDYFKTMQIPLRRGRDFSARDQYDAPFVAIVNEALARQAFGDADPIGRSIACGLDIAEVHDHRRRGRRRAVERSVAAARAGDLHAVRAASADRDVAGDRGANRGRSDGRGQRRSARSSAPSMATCPCAPAR